MDMRWNGVLHNSGFVVFYRHSLALALGGAEGIAWRERTGLSFFLATLCFECVK